MKSCKSLKVVMLISAKGLGENRGELLKNLLRMIVSINKRFEETRESYCFFFTKVEKEDSFCEEVTSNILNELGEQNEKEHQEYIKFLDYLYEESSKHNIEGNNLIMDPLKYSRDNYLRLI